MAGGPAEPPDHELGTQGEDEGQERPGEGEHSERPQQPSRAAVAVARPDLHLPPEPAEGDVARPDSLALISIPTSTKSTPDRASRIARTRATSSMTATPLALSSAPGLSATVS
jgi:hypothetical protein